MSGSGHYFIPVLDRAIPGPMALSVTGTTAEVRIGKEAERKVLTLF